MVNEKLPFEEMVLNGEYCDTCSEFIEELPAGYPQDCKNCAYEKEKADHPIEDMFGSEIQTGDAWFKDNAGRIVLHENVEDYLIEVVGVEYYREIK